MASNVSTVVSIQEADSMGFINSWLLFSDSLGSAIEVLAEARVRKRRVSIPRGHYLLEHRLRMVVFPYGKPELR